MTTPDFDRIAHEALALDEKYVIARYPDDCRDGYELVIARDDQGDVYVSVLPEGHKIGPTVRLCASGGADNVPGLLPAMWAAHTAIRAVQATDPGDLARRTAPAVSHDREALGRLVREVWIAWAQEQPNPKPSWLVPWEGLAEPDREVDRRIGERLAREGAPTRERVIEALAAATGHLPETVRWVLSLAPSQVPTWDCPAIRIRAAGRLLDIDVREPRDTEAALVERLRDQDRVLP